MRRGAPIAVLVAIGSLLAVGAADADPPSRQGWWEGASPLDPVLGPLATLGLGSVNAVDVPADGLLVQGSTNEEPAAYAAVAFDLGAAAIAGPLRLVPDPDAASVPESAIRACPLDDPDFTPAQGGSRDAGPGYDCLGAVAATIDQDGAFVIDVATLRRGDTLAVAILPGTPSTRVVFQAPGSEALAVVPAPPATTRATEAEAPRPTGGSVGSVAPRPPVATSARTSADAAPGSVVVDAAPAAVPTTPTGRAIVAARATATTSTSRGAGRAVLFGLLAVAAAALWLAAGQLGLIRTTKAVSP